MNKIIRFASVIAIACASLLYTGCTKDFSGDIARLENKDAELATSIASVNQALTDFKTTANAAIAANAEAIAKKADKSTVEALQTKVNSIEAISSANKSDIAALKSATESAQTAINEELVGIAAQFAKIDRETLAKFGSIDEQVAAIKEAAKETDEATQAKIASIAVDIEAIESKVDALKTAVEALQAQMSDVIAMVQSITYIPSSYSLVRAIPTGADTVTYFVGETPDEIAQSYLITPKEGGVFAAAQKSAPVVALTFKVTPAKAAAKLAVDNTKLIAVGQGAFAEDSLIVSVSATITSKALAEEPSESYKITSIKPRADYLKTGYVDVYAVKTAASAPTLSDVTVNTDIKKGTPVAFDKFVLQYTQEYESGVVEDITNGEAIGIYASPEAQPIEYVFVDAAKTKTYGFADATAAAAAVKADSVAVAFTQDPDSIKTKVVFDTLKWSINAIAGSIAGTPAEVAAVLNVNDSCIKPFTGDTVFFGLNGTDTYFTNVADSVVSTFPAVAVAPKVTYAALVQNNITGKFGAKINNHGAAENDSYVFGNYYTCYTIDSTSIVIDPVSIAWDWKKAPVVFKSASDKIKLSAKNFALLGADSDIANDVYTFTASAKIAGKDTTFATGTWMYYPADTTFGADIPTLHYESAPVEYTIKITRKSYVRQIEYRTSFKATVAAYPAPVEINFPTVDTTLFSFASGYSKILSSNIFDTLATYFEIGETSADTAEFITKVNTLTWGSPQYIFATGSLSTCSLSTEISPSALSYKTFNGEDSFVPFSYGTYPKYYGPKFTFKQTVNINKPEAALAGIPAYLTKVADKQYTATVQGRVEANEYVLNVVPAEQALNVIGKDLTKFAAANAYVSFKAIDAAAVIPNNHPVKATGRLNDSGLSNKSFEWGSFKGIKWSAKAYLNNAQGVAIDSVAIEFTTVDPITKFEAKGDTAVTQSTSAPTTINLVSSIVAKDFNGKDLLWTGFTATQPNYGQDLVWGPLKSDYDLGTLSYTFNNGVFELAANQAVLTAPIKISVPVTLKTNNFADKEATVTFTINPAN